MNARERIHDMIDDSGHGLYGACSQNEAAALRELDHLCEIYCEMIDEYERRKPEVVTLSMRALRDDFRLAGYGEK